MSEDDAPHFLDGPPHRLEFNEQIAPVSGQSGIDDGHALGRLDEIRGHDVVADAVEVRSKFHDGYAK
ncbi:hypothetical protein Aple_044920 [Acrocarpospora pleiomorpha]|uniref:Uncharacterized protein n=1 Tax=Acrocarpospora pleiomorpha TaxID=90975 RepID=A0A5M3XLI6_9ACTN|nr:hypothetical protein Aple_044920 [Acrocarpospora pleiomorpha]